MLSSHSHRSNSSSSLLRFSTVSQVKAALGASWSGNPDALLKYLPGQVSARSLDKHLEFNLKINLGSFEKKRTVSLQIDFHSLRSELS